MKKRKKRKKEEKKARININKYSNVLAVGQNMILRVVYRQSSTNEENRSLEIWKSLSLSTTPTS